MKFLNKWEKFIRWCKFLWQKIRQGWSDDETWSLDNTIAKFVLPRLQRFKELNFGYPPDLTWEEWNEILDDVIYAMDKCACEIAEEEWDWDRIQRGLENFGKYFRDLWW